MYKVANGMSPEITNGIFQLREKSRYNLRHATEFIIPPIHSVYNGRESVSYLPPKIWELIIPIIRQTDTLSGFKKAIKKWKPTKCPRRFPVEAILQSPLHVSLLVSLLQDINPSILIVLFNVGCSGG